MALASISAALTQYDENLVYEGDSAKAVLFLEAVRYLRGHRQQASAINGRSLSYSDLRDQEDKAAAYVLKMGSTASAARSSFVRGRPI